ncbi:hypothetical protein HJFPF1_01159 [Paramyrothecium foliicola]|nr:hypothetical protein HJFPF1_01159 [Paramyrothecium foliicola]
MPKSRSRTVVKPILKKLHSHSEKNSLDLDRRWEEQPAEFGYNRGHGHGYGAGSPDYHYNNNSGRSNDDDSAAGLYAVGSQRVAGRDVSFSLSATDVSNSASANPTKYSHARSTSGTSHISIATTASGRNGSFVHPFQQTPRTSTPPLSYANSLVSLDNSAPPVITEDDPYDLENHSSAGVGTAAYTTKPPRSYHPTNPRRPSLASQRTSSLSDVTQPLRAFTSTRSGGSGSPAMRVASQSSVNQSQTDVPLNASSSAIDSPPLSSTAPLGSNPLTAASPSSTSSATAFGTTPASTVMSPLRSSLDMNGFRLRSRSDIDTATRQEQVRQARRKFEEKEKAKEEKYAREQVKKRERADTKEAQRIERAHAQMRKASFGNSGQASSRTSSSTEARPSASRKSTSNAVFDSSGEKLAFSSRGYDSVTPGQVPHARADDVHFESARKTKTAKRKTMGAWTAFVLWFRTRLLKLGRK